MSTQPFTSKLFRLSGLALPTLGLVRDSSGGQCHIYYYCEQVLRFGTAHPTTVDYDERVLFYFTEDSPAVFVDIGSHDEVY